MNAFAAVLRRDLAIARRRGGEALLATFFYLFGSVLFPLGIGPDASRLAAVAGGLLWVMALLAALLSLDRLFQADHEDGSLEGMLLAPEPAGVIVLAKCLAHWITTGLPMTLSAPVLAVMLQLPPEGVPALVGALALGTPSLSLIGAIGAGLTLGARRGGVLLTLIVLPLYIPVLIFGAGAVEAATVGLGARTHLLVLGAELLAALALAPLAAGAALRQAVE